MKRGKFLEILVCHKMKSIVKRTAFFSSLLLALIILLHFGFYNQSYFSLQNKNVETKIDEYVKPYLEMKEFNGNILIAKGKEIIYQKSFGTADYEWNVPITYETKFNIGSLTKTFTAAAILILNKKGMLNLNDPISKFIKNFPEGNKITIDMLLTHSGGIPAEESFSDFKEKLFSAITLKEAVNRISKYPLEFEPGTNSVYSNTGYVMLAYIIERASGMTYDQFLHKEIFKPLGMSNTGEDSNLDIVEKRATGYQAGPPPYYVMKAPQLNVSHSIGAASIYSTIEDLFSWLNEISSSRFFVLDSLSYPYGWGKREYFGRKAIEQSGIYNGFSGCMLIFPNQDFKIIYLGNIHACLPFQNMKTDLAAILLGEDYKIPITRKLKTFTEKADERILGRYELKGLSKFDIVQRENGLFVEWVKFPIVQYLDFLEGNIFYNRMENAEFDFTTVFSTDSPKLIWRVGDTEIKCPKIK